MHIVVAIIIAIVFGLLAYPANSQNLPDGVSVDQKGVYLIHRYILRRYKRSEIAAFKKLAKENNVEYRIIGGK